MIEIATFYIQESVKKEIKKKIALHYSEDVREEIWTTVQLKYVEFLSEWRTDLGGKKNFHNGKGGTYDCIAIMTYYVVCKDVTSFREIEEIEENLVLPSFRKLKFVDCNKALWKKLMYKAFCSAKSKCDKWHDYEMNVAPCQPRVIRTLPKRRYLRAFSQILVCSTSSTTALAFAKNHRK